MPNWHSSLARLQAVGATCSTKNKNPSNVQGSDNLAAFIMQCRQDHSRELGFGLLEHLYRENRRRDTKTSFFFCS